MARIAAAAEVNKQLIFYYFGSKSGLYQAVVTGAATRAAEGEEPTSARRARGAGRLKQAMGRLHRRLGEEPEMAAVLLDRAPSGASQPPLRLLAEGLVEEVREAISEGQGLGYFKDDADPLVTAWQVLAMCLGYRALRDRSPASVPPEDVWIERAGDLVTRGLAW